MQCCSLIAQCLEDLNGRLLKCGLRYAKKCRPRQVTDMRRREGVRPMRFCSQTRVKAKQRDVKCQGTLRMSDWKNKNGLSKSREAGR